jgi:putative salt-induced outer membrane protein
MKHTLMATLIAASFSSAAFAQAPAGPSGEWKGSVSLGASYSNSFGGVKNTSFSLASDASRETRQDKIALYGIALFGKSDGVKTAENLKFGGRYEWNLSPQLYAFGSLDLERDGVANLDLRSVLGLGAGYYVIKSEPTTFTVFGGIAFRNDKFGRIDGITPSSTYSATELLLGEESSHKISNDVTFKQRLVVYPNLKDSGDMRASFDATLSVKLAGAWNMNLSLINRYDSEAPRKNDTGLFLGVGAKFGK